MVMGGDSRSEGREFESEHRILVGHFFTLMCCNVCLKKTEHKRKRGRGWPIQKKYSKSVNQICTSTVFENTVLYYSPIDVNGIQTRILFSLYFSQENGFFGHREVSSCCLIKKTVGESFQFG